MKRGFKFLFGLIIMCLLAGCSGGASNPVESPAFTGPVTRMEEVDSSRHMLGAWDITIDTHTSDVTVTPSRKAFMHMNITQYLYPPFCDDCLLLQVLELKPAQGYAKVEVTVKNQTVYSGYDVRGILVSNDTGMDIINADAYTDLWDDGEGKKYNPFIAFAVDQNKRKALPGTSHTRICEVAFPSLLQLITATIVFDASWPGNCAEPYYLDDFSQYEPLLPGGGASFVSMQVKDWQADISGVFVNMSPLGGDITALTHDNGDTWNGDVTTIEPNVAGLHRLLTYAESSGTSTRLYQYVDFGVSPCSKEGNENSAGAVLVNVDEDQIDQVVCIGDQTDWYRFWIEDHLYGTLAINQLSETGDYYFAFYEDPTETELLYDEGDYDSDVVLDLTSLDLGPGGYYFVVGYLGNDYENREYDLLNNTGDSICYPDGNDAYNTALELQLGDDTGVQYVCPDDKDDWCGFYYGTGTDATLQLTVTSETGPVEITLYDETQASNPDGPNLNTQQTETEVEIDLAGLSLPSGNYYVRIKHEGSDQLIREYTLEYKSPYTGWGLSWGGSNYDHAYDVAVDTNGNVFVTGTFYSTIDFDPGPGVVEVTPQGQWDAYLSKFDSSGDFMWVRTWGPGTFATTPTIEPTGLAVAQSGNAYICGNFNANVDFDPGPGVNEIVTCGSEDPFVVKLDNDGTYLDAFTWGGTTAQFADDITLDAAENIYITGGFSGTCDFVPGPGTYSVAASTTLDMYLNKLTSSGAFSGVYTQGFDYKATGKAVDLDALGNAYVAVFRSPGATSDGATDTLLKILADGSLDWSHTWYWNLWDVHVDAANYIYLTGGFEDSFDFDPGPGIDFHSPLGNGEDPMLVKLASDGTYEWGVDWGGDVDDSAVAVGSDSEMDIYIAGNFESPTIDMNPGVGEDWLDIATGSSGTFLLKLDGDGSYQWGRIWEFPEAYSMDRFNGLAVTPASYIHIAGTFRSADTDFNPGPGIDLHSPLKGHDAMLIKVKFDGLW